MTPSSLASLETFLRRGQATGPDDLPASPHLGESPCASSRAAREGTARRPRGLECEGWSRDRQRTAAWRIRRRGARGWPRSAPTSPGCVPGWARSAWRSPSAGCCPRSSTPTTPPSVCSAPATACSESSSFVLGAYRAQRIRSALTARATVAHRLLGDLGADRLQHRPRGRDHRPRPRGGVNAVSRYASSRELVVEVCRTLLDRGYLKATEGNVSVRVPGEDSLRDHAVQLRLREDGARRHLRARPRRAAHPGREEGLDRGRHARGRVRAAAGRERHHPHAPAVRERAGADGAADPRPVRRTGALPRPLGRARLVRPVGDELPQEERGEEDRERRQRVHPREPRGARARRRRRAGRAQHGAAREGRPGLPAGAAHRRPRREGAAAHPRDRLPEAAQGREEAGRAGRGGARRARGGGDARERARGGRAGCARGAGGRRRARARAAGAPGAGAVRPGHAGRPLRRPARRLRHQPLPGRPRRLQAADRPRHPAHPSGPPRRHGRLPRLLRREVPPQQGTHRRGDGTDPRRRAAQPGLQLPVPAGHREGRGRTPVGRGRQRVHRLPAGRRPHGARQQLRAGAPQGRGGRRAVRPRHRPLPRVRAQAGGAREPAHAGLRDVPHARLRHGERDGGHPRRACVHRQEVGGQGRRRVPRLERPDGLRPARARHLAVRGQRHPVRRHGDDA